MYVCALTMTVPVAQCPDGGASSEYVYFKQPGTMCKSTSATGAQSNVLL